MNQPFNLIEAAIAFLDDRYRRGFVRVSADNRVLLLPGMQLTVDIPGP